MIRRGIRRLFRLPLRRKDVVERDVSAEIELHIAMRAEQLMREGLTPDTARVEALRRFGSFEYAAAQVNDAAVHRERTMQFREWIDALLQDATYAARSLRHDPLVTAFIATTFALGIGANAAMFGVVDRLLLKGPRHIADPARVMRVYASRLRPDGSPYTGGTFGYVTYAALRDGAHSIDGVAAYTLGAQWRVGRGVDAATIATGAATSDLFTVLGTQPERGRFFTAAEDRTSGAEHVVVISDGYWRRAYAASPSVAGTPITLNDELFTIVGVAPPGFTGPELGHVDVWVPMSYYSRGFASNWPASWNGQWLQVIARLKAGVPVAKANADITSAYRNAYPGTSAALKKVDLSLRPLIYARDGKEPPEVSVARWLVGVAAIVLVIACSNIVNLLLARAVRRRREVAVRIALGAGRARIVRLLVTESVMLAMLGGVASIAVAFGMSKLVRGVLMPNVDWVSPPVNAPLLVVSAAIAVALGVAVGLVPALQISRPDLTSALKTGVRDGGGQAWRLRATLTVAQAALSMVLLVGAGLFVTSLVKVKEMDLGIQPDRVLIANIGWPSLPPGAPAEAAKAERARQALTYMSAMERVRAVSGIEDASLSVGLPFQTAFSQPLRVPGWDSLPQLSSGSPRINAIASDYFETVGSRMVRGRAFTAADRSGSEPVAIVNETMAATLWPGRDPVGDCLFTGGEPAPCSRIVGIAGDAHRDRVKEPAGMQYYVPFGQERGIGGTALLIRPAGLPARAMAAVRKALLELDPTIAFVRMQLLQDSLEPEIRPWRLGATVFAMMGLLALLVAAVGLYSVMSYLVAQRTHEFGIRVALGASGANIAALILRGGVGMAAAGVVVGLGLALALGRFVAPLLFDTSPHDVTVLVAVSASLLIVALLATAVPALRAKGANPMQALRAE